MRRPMSREQDHLLWISNEDGQRWVSYSEDLESFVCCALVDVCGGLYCYYLVYKVFLHICGKFDENTCTITQIMTKNAQFLFSVHSVLCFTGGGSVSLEPVSGCVYVCRSAVVRWSRVPVCLHARAHGYQLRTAGPLRLGAVPQ